MNVNYTNFLILRMKIGYKDVETQCSKMKLTPVDFTSITDALKGTPWYVSDEKDPLGISIVIQSKNSTQYFSVACALGSWTGIHGSEDEYPSILPEHYGKYRCQTMDDVIEFNGPEDVIPWLQQNMDKETTFPKPCWLKRD